MGTILKNIMEKGLIVHTVITDEAGKILIIQRAKENDILSGYWDIPGGTLEDGEDPIVGAMRETREETGLSIEQLNLFDYTSNVDLEKDKQFVRLIFWAKRTSEFEDIILSPQEHSDYRWLDINEMFGLDLVDYLMPCLQHLRDRHYLTL